MTRTLPASHVAVPPGAPLGRRRDEPAGNELVQDSFEAALELCSEAGAEPPSEADVC